MRIRGAAAGAWLTALCAPAAAEESARYWRVVFSSVEVERETAFASTGVKLGRTVSADTSLVLMSSHGFSLGDADRVRRTGWAMQHVEQQSRVFVGFERGIGTVHIAAAVGLSHARVLARHQIDRTTLAIALADATGIERRLIPEFLATVPPALWRGFLPPRMETRTGAVLDVSLWWRPQSDRYTHLAFVGDSAARSLFTRLRLGWKAEALPFAIGPEASVSGGTNWHKLRAGLHMGDLKVWRISIEAAGGVMTDETRKTGIYGTASAHVRF